MALTDNLVAYRKLDESSGNAADSVGSYTLTNNWTATYSAGKINNWVNTTTSKYLSHATFLDSWYSAWSFSFWVKTTMSWTRAFIIDKTSPTKYPCEILISAENKLELYINPWVWINNIFTSTWTINDWNRHHCVVYGNSTGRASIGMYIDWSSTWSFTYSGGIDSWAIVADTWNDFTVWLRWDNTFPFTGSIDEIWFYDRVLTSDEITTLYNWWNWLQYPFTTVWNPWAFLQMF